MYVECLRNTQGVSRGRNRIGYEQNFIATVYMHEIVKDLKIEYCKN